MKWDFCFTLYTKISPKQIKDLNVQTKTIKLLEENRGVNLCELQLDNGFLDMIPKAQAIKEKKSEFIKIKNFCVSKDSLRKVKR